MAMARRRWRSGLLALCVAALAPAASRAQGSWRTYENARLDTTAYFDGDSFWIRAGRHRAIYRIYYVDAPEMDRSVPERVVDQARYWGISEDEVIRLGREATAFAREFMRDGVTVYTRRQGARGRSRAPRYFGFIEANGEFLCAALVHAGLGRVYGFATDLPDGTPQVRYWAHLRRLEREARAEGRGAWAVREAERGSNRPSAVIPDLPEQTVTVTRSTTVRNPEPPHAAMGILRRGRRAVLVEAVSPTQARVRFEVDGEGGEGLCNLVDLQLDEQEDEP